MTLPTLTEQQMIDGMATTFGSQTGVPPVFQSGDVLLAIFQTVAVQLDFLQALVEQVVLLTRAQTSTGSDLDAWMAQFGLTRLPATYAEGLETFSASAPVPGNVNIPAAVLTSGVYTGGALVQSSNSGVVYQVIPNTANAAYDTPSNSYILQAGQTSVSVNIQAVNAGSASNVAAGALVVLASAVPGISFVNNSAPISSGVDAEIDAAFRTRFVAYLNTLAKATEAAVVEAALTVQQGLQITPVEYQDTSGNPLVGAFSLFVDDGSGSPPSGLITNVAAAVNATRAFGIRAFIAGPNVTAVSIAITIRIAAGYTLGTVEAAVQNAIVALVSSLLVNQTLYVSSVEAAALSIAGVVSVKPGTTLNGVNADLTPAYDYELRANTGIVSIGTY